MTRWLATAAPSGPGTAHAYTGSGAKLRSPSFLARATSATGAKDGASRVDRAAAASSKDSPQPRWQRRMAATAAAHPLPDGARRPFYFVRHGETEYNRRRLIQGTVDAPLNDAGRAQAETVAVKLTGVAVGRIVTSDLARAVATALPVARVRKVPIHYEPRLRERDFGEYERTPVVADYWDYEPQRGESVEAFSARVIAAVAAALGDDEPLIVAHGGVLRVIDAALALALPRDAFANATPLRFAPEGDGWTWAPVGEAAR